MQGSRFRESITESGGYNIKLDM